MNENNEQTQANSELVAILVNINPTLSDPEERDRKKSKAQEIIKLMTARSNGRAKRYGTSSAQMKQITTLIMKLAERYRLEYDAWKNEDGEAIPGNWFGLQEISSKLLDSDTQTYISTYRMDSNLCEILKMPEASTCKALQVGSKTIKLHIPDFYHSLRELAEIKRRLKKTVYMFMLQIPT
jgi:hypothetical protein